MPQSVAPAHKHMDAKENGEVEVTASKAAGGKTIDEWIKQANAFGPYQWFLTFCHILFIIGANVNVAMAGYYGGVTPDWQCCNTTRLTDCSSNSSCTLYEGCAPDELRYSAQFHGYVQDFGLLCDRSFYVPLGNTLQMIGLLVGSLLVGQAADRWGRKWTAIAVTGCNTLTGLALAFSNSWQLLAALLFINGLFIGAGVVVLWVLVAEQTSNRPLVLIRAIGTSSVIFGYTVTGIAYATQGWRLMLLVGNGIQLLLPLCLVFGVSESVRWLLCAQRPDEATTALRRIARINRRALPAHIHYDNGDAEARSKSSLYVWHLFTANRTLLLYSLIGSIAFYSCQQAVLGMFYGFNLLGDQLYLNYFLLMSTGFFDLGIALVDFSWPQLLGRRLLTCVTMGAAVALNTAIALSMALGVSDSSWALVVLSMLGQTASYEAVNLGLYTHFLELYPTELRGIAGSYVSVWYNVGGAVAPLIEHLHQVWHPLPYVVYAAQMLASLVLVLCLLPETKHRPPPETINDM